MKHTRAQRTSDDNLFRNFRLKSSKSVQATGPCQGLCLSQTSSREQIIIHILGRLSFVFKKKSPAQFSRPKKDHLSPKQDISKKETVSLGPDPT